MDPESTDELHLPGPLTSITLTETSEATNKPMKNLLIFAKILSSVAMVYAMAACASTPPAEGTASATSQKETLLTQAGFKSKTVTTAKQKELVGQLAANKVSAVKYQGKLYYAYPTATKDNILVGRQAQFDAYKQALATKQASLKAQQANQRTAEQQQMVEGDPVWVGETAGPRHITVETFDGFGPLDPMEGD